MIRTVKNVQELTAPAQHVMTANISVGLVEVLMSVVSLVSCSVVLCTVWNSISKGTFFCSWLLILNKVEEHNIFQFCYSTSNVLNTPWILLHIYLLQIVTLHVPHVLVLGTISVLPVQTGTFPHHPSAPHHLEHVLVSMFGTDQRQVIFLVCHELTICSSGKQTLNTHMAKLQFYL